MLKLKNNDRPDVIWVGDMMDGDIGVITSWPTGGHLLVSKYIGRIVQRYKNDLITVGASWTDGWGTRWPNVEKNDPQGFQKKLHKVRLLQSGEALIVD
jgi:hypothetical protein